MDYKKLGEVISLKDLSTLGDAELQLLRETVNDVIKARRNETAAIVKATLKEGMEVSVDHPKVSGMVGVITKVNRKKAKVKFSSGAYTVPLSMIEIL